MQCHACSHTRSCVSYHSLLQQCTATSGDAHGATNVCSAPPACSRCISSYLGHHSKTRADSFSARLQSNQGGFLDGFSFPHRYEVEELSRERPAFQTQSFRVGGCWRPGHSPKRGGMWAKAPSSSGDLPTREEGFPLAGWVIYLHGFSTSIAVRITPVLPLCIWHALQELA